MAKKADRPSTPPPKKRSSNNANANARTRSPPPPPPGTPPPPLPANRPRHYGNSNNGPSSPVHLTPVQTPVQTPENSETDDDFVKAWASQGIDNSGGGGGFPAHLQPQTSSSAAAAAFQQQSSLTRASSTGSPQKNTSRMPHRRSFTFTKTTEDNHQNISSSLSPNNSSSPKKKGGIAASLGRKMKRSISLGSGTGGRNSDHSVKSELYEKSGMSSLFTVSFPEDEAELAQIVEFEKASADDKNMLWYFAKELRTLMTTEIDHARRYEEGDFDMFSIDQEDLEEVRWMSKAMSGTVDDPDELCSWRGLEHILEDEDRSARIRKTIVGIVSWYRDAKEMGYNDPEELRVVSKSRTKSDRTKAQKRGTQDASFIKKMLKGEATGSRPSQHSRQSSSGGGGGSRSMSPKKMVQKVSRKINMPKMHWSPKPSKKEKLIAMA